MDKGQPDKSATTRTREERLAEKLRENLRRRKAQARALSGDLPDTGRPEDEAQHETNRNEPQPDG